MMRIRVSDQGGGVFIKYLPEKLREKEQVVRRFNDLEKGYKIKREALWLVLRMYDMSISFCTVFMSKV